MPKSILLLSSEQSEQQSVAEALRTVDPEVQITTVTTPAAAAAALEHGAFDALFIQCAGGAEEGVNFASEVWNRTPQVNRFVLAPEIDAETQIRCVFGAHIYLPTPIDACALRAALELTGAKNAILRSERLQVLISRTRSLPSKPKVYFEVLRELRSPDANVNLVATRIEKDAGIASKLLQVVNSLFYGRAEAVHDLKEAILFLGFEVTASIVLSLEAITRFEKVPSVHELSTRVWAHSQSVAELSRRICQSFGHDTPSCDQAFLAALLHDLGKLVLAQNFPAEFKMIAQRAVKEGKTAAEIEKDILGVSHADAGAYLLAAWGLPLPIVEAVAAHESPASTVNGPFSPAIALHLAEAMTESGKPVEEILADYPAELLLENQMESLAALMPRRQTRESRLALKIEKANAGLN
jgi:putative nucleotidyltransferase with HDIG domain